MSARGYVRSKGESYQDVRPLRDDASGPLEIDVDAARRYLSSQGGIDGEQNHAWWPVYEEYKETFERLLQSFLDESGVSSHQFAEAARHATGMAETYLIVINALSDYTMFVEMVTEEEAKQRRSIVGADGRVRDPAEEVMEMERMRQGKQQQPVWGGGEDDPDWVPTDHAPDHAPGAAEADAG